MQTLSGLDPGRGELGVMARRKRVHVQHLLKPLRLMTKPRFRGLLHFGWVLPRSALALIVWEA